MPAPPSEAQLHALLRGTVEVTPGSDLRERLMSGDTLRVKLGLDPTAGDVHLGWSVVLRKLRGFQDLGHTAVLIVGDFTARIGDPSGRDKTRPMLTAEQVKAYADRLIDQFSLIVDTDNLEVRYNSEWLEPLDVPGILKLTSNYTVAKMLQRNDFADRFAEGSSITVTEFLYPLLQAYDSVAVSADVELGGLDQTFNLHAGRDIQRAFGQRPQVVFTVPLLVGTDGHKKMSQSLGNYIGICEPPNEMFGKLMSISDEIMREYFELCTPVPDDEIERILNDDPPQEAKRRLAEQIVALYHGVDAGKEARAVFDQTFKQHEIPDDVPEVRCSWDEMLSDAGQVHLPHLLKEAGLASSTGEARRIIGQGGVHVGDEVVTDLDVPLDVVKGNTVRVGKRRFVKFV